MKKAIYLIFILLLIPSVTIAKKVTCNNGEYNITFEIEKEKIKIGETLSIVPNSQYEYEINYRVVDDKIVSINDSGQLIGLKNGSTKVNVDVNFIKEGNVDTTCNINFAVDVLSSNSKLKKLTTEEYNLSNEFKPDKYDYTISVPYNIEKINIIAEAEDESSKITGDGRRYINEGSNEFDITVIATDGSKTNYRITINREEASDDATLKSLAVEGYILNPAFNKDTYKYSLNIDKSVDEITIEAEPNYELARIIGIGTFKIASGKNTYYITVTAENGYKNKYEIIINKNNGTSKLKSLSIEDYKLNEKFSSDIYTYNITVNNSVKNININAEAYHDDQIEIIGNENFKNGENEIIIRVTSKDKSTTTYKINVYKLSEKEEQIQEKNNNLLRFLLILFIISIVFMSISIIIFIKRNYKKYKKRKTKNVKLK